MASAAASDARTWQRAVCAAAIAVACATCLPSVAQADFGIVPGSVSAVAENQDGTIASQAGSHPYTYVVSLKLNTIGSELDGGAARDIIADLPPGFVGNPFALPRCTRQQFEGVLPKCSPDTQVGVLHATVPNLGQVRLPIFNISPPPGAAAQLGASAVSLNALQNASVRTEEGYGVRVGAFNIPTPVSEVEEVIWGVPADSSHDSERGGQAIDGGPPVKSGATPAPFITLPTSCDAPPEITIRVDSKLNPGVFVEESALSLDAGGNPAPLAGCDGVPFSPQISATPTTRVTESPSGLDFELKLPDQGLLSIRGISESQPKKTEVTLPEGVTVNPSLAEGVAVCTPAQYAAEKIDSPAGAGCPEGSKLGSIVARSPLLDEAIEGSLYLAAPYDNPFGTLTALYLIARAPQRGVLVKQAGRVDLNPDTGQITSTFSDLPPVPYSSFQLHFREGARAPLVTPPACGTYQTVSHLTPFSSSQAVTVNSAMTIERGPDGGPCPAGGLPPFHPGLIAGSLNNAAGRFSPFNVRLFRTDSEQEITRFSIKLPPGIAGKLAGVSECSDAAIAQAKSREVEGGGSVEESNPSCPANSEVGHSLVGSGVGNVLAYAPGKLYIAGPYHGSNLSLVSITAAKVGPFDLGTVVVRFALKIDPETAEVSVDGRTSDPIPHIVDGIPVHLRDIRAYVDRPNFTYNPTSCAKKSTASTILGSGLNFASEADDQPVTVTSPFQAADCASLGFKPKLALSLKGGTHRGATPAFKAVLTYPKGAYANTRTSQVTLPHSEFLEQAHIGTVCTRVQFAAGAGNGSACPPASVYGRAKAVTPVLEEPVTGPVILRSSSHNLPDLVLALHNRQVDFNAVGRIDSVKSGRIRNTFEAIPDVPLSSVTLEMQGGKKGLLVNSTNLCKGTNRAISDFTAQNGKVSNTNPVLKAQCGKAKKKGGGKKGKRHG